MMELHCTLWQNVAEIESCSQGWWNKECQHLLRTCKQNSWNTVSDWVINLPDTMCLKYREDFKKLNIYFHLKELKNYSIISWGFCFTTIYQYTHLREREIERERDGIQPRIEVGKSCFQLIKYAIAKQCPNNNHELAICFEELPAEYTMGISDVGWSSLCLHNRSDESNYW